jgi:hypothetical protein
MAPIVFAACSALRVDPAARQEIHELSIVERHRGGGSGVIRTEASGQALSAAVAVYRRALSRLTGEGRRKGCWGSHSGAPSRSVEVLLVTARLLLLVGQRVGFAFFRPGSNADRFPIVERVLSQLPVLEPAVVGELPPYLPLEIGVLVALAPPLFEQPALRMRCPRLVEKDLGRAEQRKVVGETGHQLEGYFGARCGFG